MKKLSLVFITLITFLTFLDKVNATRCTYEGKNADGDTYKITIGATTFKNTTTYEITDYINGKENKNYEATADMFSSEYISNHIYGTSIKGNKIFYSKIAANQIIAGGCPTYAFYETNYFNSFCFQEPEDVQFCISKDDNFVQLNNTKGDTTRRDWIDSDDPKIKIDSNGNLCEGIFYNDGKATDFANILQQALNIIKYVAPILVLVLSSIDYLKSIISQDKDEIKKVTKKSAIRLILAVLLFFLPIIINYLLIVLFGIKDPTCGLM